MCSVYLRVRMCPFSAFFKPTKEPSDPSPCLIQFCSQQKNQGRNIPTASLLVLFFKRQIHVKRMGVIVFFKIVSLPVLRSAILTRDSMEVQ